MAKEETGDTPAQESPQADTQSESANWEKRYKDLQPEYTKVTQEIKRIKEEYAKDKELLDSVTPYIDWSKVNGVAEDGLDGDDGYVSKKELDAKIRELKQTQEIARITMDFRRKYPDMVEYEDQVGFYLQNKTDPRHKMSVRIEKAVEYTKKFLEAERAKGASMIEKETKEAKSKEATAAGLKGGDQAIPSKEDVPESAAEYVAYLRESQEKRKMVI